MSWRVREGKEKNKYNLEEQAEEKAENAIEDERERK